MTINVQVQFKAELRALKLGDFSIDAYFLKIEAIATILTSLVSSMNNDDVVTFALEGLPAKYDNISTIISHREPFPDLKTTRSMLTTDEMRLKSRVQEAYVDSTSSSPMVLLANSGNNARRSPLSMEKVHGNSSTLSTPTPSSNGMPSSSLSPTNLHTTKSFGSIGFEWCQ